MPPRASASLRAAFAAFDADGSGSLTIDELREILSRPLEKTRGRPLLNEKQIKLFLRLFDEDRNGTLEIDEFIAGWDHPEW